MKNKIAANLSYLQEKSGKTKKAFAEKYGIKDTTFSSYITGRVTPPIDLLMAICDGEGVDLDWLCGRSYEHSKITAGQIGQMLYRLKATEALFYSKIDVKANNDGDITQAIITIGDNPVLPASGEFLEMLKKISDHFEILDRLNKEQSDVIRDSIIKEYSDKFVY